MNHPPDSTIDQESAHLNKLNWFTNPRVPLTIYKASMESEQGKLESPWPCLRRDLLTSSSWTLCWPKARSDDKCWRTLYNCMSSDYIDSCEANTIPHDGQHGQRCTAFSRVLFVKKLFGKVELASSKMCVRTSRPITWMVPPWPRYAQAYVDIKELPPGCNFDVVSYCCTTLHYPFCCKTQAGQGNLMRLYEGNLKCSLGKLYQWSMVQLYSIYT